MGDTAFPGRLHSWQPAGLSRPHKTLHRGLTADVRLSGIQSLRPVLALLALAICVVLGYSLVSEFQPAPGAAVGSPDALSLRRVGVSFHRRAPVRVQRGRSERRAS
jgi:hypothetical protein